jgi:hypothetical protein
LELLLRPSLKLSCTLIRTRTTHKWLIFDTSPIDKCGGGITATVEKARSSVKSSCIKNTKLGRKKEKKLKERKLRRRRQNSHCARSAGETKPKTGHVTGIPRQRRHNKDVRFQG